VDRRVPFVAPLSARRPLNHLVEPAAQATAITPIPVLAPRPSAVPKSRRNPTFSARKGREEDTMRLHSFALALATIGLAVPAAAAEDKAPTVAVRYADLDLTSEAGQRQLDMRLERAAREVCGMDETMVGSHLRSTESRTCYREARRDLDREFAELVNRKSAAGG
jgi:UrcA family protein